jgi:hypothetical protein
VESAWKVRGKLEGVGVESAWVWAWKVLGELRGYVGVESAWKVRVKCVESCRVWAWKVRGKLEGVNKRKVG